MSKIIEENINVSINMNMPFTIRKKIEKINHLEKQTIKIKKEIIEAEEKKLKELINKKLPQLNIQELKIYKATVQYEKTIEDFKFAKIKINNKGYFLIYEQYTEYIYPEDAIKYMFNYNFEIEFPDETEKLKEILSSRPEWATRIMQIIY